MNRTLSISVIALIAIVMVVGIVSPAMAKEGNNGNNGCENANPNAKACENNPNTESITCQDCLEKYYEDLAAGSPTAISDFHSCNDVVEITSGEYCSDVPPNGF